MMIQNITSGKWAVAIVGYKGWRRDSAIGDGITSAQCALVTRCESREQAEAIVAEMTAELPGVMPGDPEVPEYEARVYRRTDYLSRQDLRNGSRDADRRIVRLV